MPSRGTAAGLTASPKPTARSRFPPTFSISTSTDDPGLPLASFHGAVLVAALPRGKTRDAGDAPGHARAAAPVGRSRRDAHGGARGRLRLLRHQRSVAGRTAKSARSRDALGAGDQG